MWLLLVVTLCLVLIFTVGGYRPTFDRAGFQANPFLAVLVLLLFLIALIQAMLILAGQLGSATFMH